MLTADNLRHENGAANDSVFIYGLVCPIEGLVRYVGQTDNPYSRLFGHIRSSKNAGIREWTDRLIVDGRIPQVITLEITLPALAHHREKVWIQHYFNRHADRLLNIACVPTPPAFYGKQRRSGRPPIGEVRFDSKMLVECMEDQKSLWKIAAKTAGQSLSQWVRNCLDAAAK